MQPGYIRSLQYLNEVERKREIRPWGEYTVLAYGEGYKVKRIIVNPGERISLQRHNESGEHWTVVSGRAEVELGGEAMTL